MTVIKYLTRIQFQNALDVLCGTMKCRGERARDGAAAGAALLLAATGPAARTSTPWPGMTATPREEQNSGAGAMLAFALQHRV